VGWSFVADRADLAKLGMPLTLLGQTGWLIAIVLQVDGLWQHQRDAAEMLTDLDGRLRDLQHTASLLGASHSTAAQSFYAHLAEGANPTLLLADLKGQLDLLALQLDRRAA
jgi:hypothetical protein